MLRGHKQNLVCTRRLHRDWARPAFECMNVSYRGTSQQWPAAGALGAAEVWHKPSWRRSPLTHYRATRTYRTGKTDSCRAQTKPCVHWPHKRLTQTCLWVSRSLQQSHGSAVAWCRVGGTEYGSACMGPFEGGHHYLHYLHHSLTSGQTTGREHSPAHQQKIGLKIYWAWPCPSEQDPFSLRKSSHQEASISLVTLSIRGRIEWKPLSQKTSQTDHMDHSLV